MSDGVGTVSRRPWWIPLGVLAFIVAAVVLGESPPPRHAPDAGKPYETAYTYRFGIRDETRPIWTTSTAGGWWYHFYGPPPEDGGVRRGVHFSDRNGRPQVTVRWPDDGGRPFCEAEP